MLEKIQGSRDVKTLSDEETDLLCKEIRRDLISTVARNGGHLSSNLGVVELTVALHQSFDFPTDKIIFDVGHQSYIHKMLTGRYSRFSTLRQYKGISGFPRREESEYDCFNTGHASTSISAALGLARARDYNGQSFHVIAVIGDGALTGGMCYEAMNDAGNSGTRLIVILNDNEMSISKNVGALSSHLTNLRAGKKWQRAKRNVRKFKDVPVIGKPVYRLIHGTKVLLKTALMHDQDSGFFNALGFEYYGPIDGHDVHNLKKTFDLVKNFTGPCIIHVKTKKGYGYEMAEKRPEAFHGTPPFILETGDRIKTPDYPSCGHVMADTLADMAKQDPRIVAITAAMPLGTGLDHFSKVFPDRFLDTGITEEHAATMAAGLAAGGMRPYFAVYASFFQRCYDQMIHDVCMQRLPVVFLLDRSGIGGEDGKTHHGLFDFSALLPVPGMTVLAPCDSRELSQMIRWTLTQDGPCAIRYVRNGTPLTESRSISFRPGHWNTLSEGKDAVLLSCGTMVSAAIKVSELLKDRNINAAVINCSSVKPLDEDFLSSLSGVPFFTLEEHMKTGGFGMYVMQTCHDHGWTEPLRCFAVENSVPEHGAHDILLKEAGLDSDSIAEAVLNVLNKKDFAE